MECYSCNGISGANFVVQNSLSNSVPLNNCIRMCCEGTAPITTLTSNAKENLERFFGMRHLAMIHGLSDNVDEDFPCAKCDFYVKRDWQFSNCISYVNLSMYPSPCQCRCFYCGVHKNSFNSFESFKHPQVQAMYEYAFDTLKLAKKIGAVVPQQTKWQLSSGEITIHPYKKEFLNLIRGGVR